jgi:hypothetical protein
VNPTREVGMQQARHDVLDQRAREGLRFSAEEVGDGRCPRMPAARLVRVSGMCSSERGSRGASRRGGENPRGRNERGRWKPPAEAGTPTGRTAGVNGTSEKPWRGTPEKKSKWSQLRRGRACASTSRSKRRSDARRHSGVPEVSVGHGREPGESRGTGRYRDGGSHGVGAR